MTDGLKAGLAYPYSRAEKEQPPSEVIREPRVAPWSLYHRTFINICVGHIPGKNRRNIVLVFGLSIESMPNAKSIAHYVCITTVYATSRPRVCQWVRPAVEALSNPLRQRNGSEGPRIPSLRNCDLSNLTTSSCRADIKHVELYPISPLLSPNERSQGVLKFGASQYDSIMGIGHRQEVSCIRVILPDVGHRISRVVVAHNIPHCVRSRYIAEPLVALAL